MWNDNFTAYGQATIRNGGRNGIALTAGFRWSLGKDGKAIEKVNSNQIKTATQDSTERPEKKVIKQQVDNRNVRNIQNLQTTTKSNANAIIKKI